MLEVRSLFAFSTEVSSVISSLLEDECPTRSDPSAEVFGPPASTTALGQGCQQGMGKKKTLYFGIQNL